MFFFFSSRSLFLFRSSVFARTPLFFLSQFSSSFFFSSFLLTLANLYVSSKHFFYRFINNYTYFSSRPPRHVILSLAKTLSTKLSPYLQHFFMSLNRRCSFLPVMPFSSYIFGCYSFSGVLQLSSTVPSTKRGCLHYRERPGWQK